VYRAQFAFPAAPPGYTWQPCIYQWDKTNVPALGSLSLATGQETGYIPLEFDKDAPFVMHGIKLGTGRVNVQLWDSDGNALMDTYVNPVQYASQLPPITTLEGPGIEVAPGAIFQLKLQGQ
jgi:hypothetical protein